MSTLNNELGYLHSSNQPIEYDQHVKDTFQFWYFKLAKLTKPITDDLSGWAANELINYLD